MSCRSLSADEEVDICVKPFMKDMKLPHWLRRVLSWATENRYRFMPIRMKGWFTISLPLHNGYI